MLGDPRSMIGWTCVRQDTILPSLGELDWGRRVLVGCWRRLSLGFPSEQVSEWEKGLMSGAKLLIHQLDKSIDQFYMEVFGFLQVGLLFYCRCLLDVNDFLF